MLVWTIIIGTWIIDRVIKILIQGHFLPTQTQVIIPKVFHLTYILNPGAAFGLMAGRTWIFVVTALVVTGAIIFAQFHVPREAKLIRIALGMIGGGALGNLYDRLVIGRVVDYLDFKIWPYIFNFADAMVVIGVGLLLLALYFQERESREINDDKR